MKPAAIATEAGRHVGGAWASRLILAGVVLALLALLLMGAAPGRAKITRGPYLQAAAPGSVSVVWYTDVADGGALHWRVDGGPWREARASAAGLRHEALIADLDPEAEYEYRLADAGGALLSAGAAQSFAFQAPPVGGLELAAFGDCGAASPEQYAVAQAVERHRPSPDSVLLLGDVVYPHGADADYDARFFAPYARLLPRLPFLAVIGNHDLETGAGRPYLDVFSLPRNGPTGLAPETAYSFDRGGVHFVAHDSNLPEAALRDVAAPWHVADARASAARFKLAALHHSPYSSGENSVSAQSALVRALVTPLFARTGVDLVFAGHDHTYERTRPIEGVVYVTSGAGGYALYPRVAVHDYTEVFYNARHSFSAVSVQRRVLRLDQLDADGCRVDSLALDKPVAEGDLWRVLPGAAAPPADWARPEFDDRAWRAAAAGFGYGAPDVTTTLADMPGAYLSLYARIAFDLPNAAVVDDVLLRLRYDDGFVAYLNGVEVARRNVPASQGARTPASAAHAPEPFESLSLPRHALRSGRNVLALEGHNAGPSDASFVLAPELTLLSADPGRCP
jgi:3',5'-cyclic AMP phosphodiesterase CpdA